MTASHAVAGGQNEYDPVLLAHAQEHRPPALPGHLYYVPEEHYFYDTPGFPTDLAYRVTARTLAQWADRYWARNVVGCGIEPREGLLTGSAADRTRGIDAVFSWFDGIRADHDFLGLSLLAADKVLGEWSDGFPATMLLTGAMFRALRRAWRANGLPDDLFHRASARRSRVETRFNSDGMPVRRRYYYSPRRWPLRPRSTGATIKLPSDADLAGFFARAYLPYQRMLFHLRDRLWESDEASDKDLLEAIYQQLRASSSLILRVSRWGGTP